MILRNCQRHWLNSLSRSRCLPTLQRLAIVTRPSVSYLSRLSSDLLVAKPFGRILSSAGRRFLFTDCLCRACPILVTTNFGKTALTVTINCILERIKRHSGREGWFRFGADRRQRLRVPFIFP